MKLKKSLWSFLVLVTVGCVVTVVRAETLSEFINNLVTKDLGLHVEEDAAVEGDLYVGEKVGIGTVNPTEKLTVEGVVEAKGGVKFADGSVLNSAGGAGGSPRYLIVEDRRSNRSGGGSTNGSFQTRALNTVVHNSIEGASLSANKFLLPMGTYRIRFSAPAYNCNQHKTRLRNVTDGNYPVYGSSEMAFYAQTRSFGEGVVTIDSDKEFLLQHRCRYGRTHGLGYPSSMGTEVYAQVFVEKLD